MGGKGSGGHNKRSIQDHIRMGTYRLSRHGPLPEKLAARVHGKNHGRPSKGKAPAPVKRPPAKHLQREQPAKAAGKQPPAKVLQGVGALQVPSWFDPLAAEAFRRVCKALVERGTLQDVNHATLEGYCEAYSKAVRADKVLNEKNFTVAGKKRPEVDISFRAWGQVKMFAVELGITQSAGTPEPPKGKDEEKKRIVEEADELLRQHRADHGDK